ncbi:MAG: HupE/UreJ family protein [Verrucomicrobiota bacterium]
MNLKTVAAFVSSFAFAFLASAHDPGLSTLKLQRDGQQLRATLIFAAGDINAVVPVDQNSDGTISAEESAAALEILNKLAGNLLEVSLDNNPLPLLETKCARDTNDNFRFDMTFAPSPGAFLKVISKWLDLLPSGHRQFVSFQEGNGAAMTEDLLDAANNIFTTDISPSPRQTPKQYSFSEFFVLGIHHIWTGYDHLLFLFALLIVCDSFASIAKIVTCFTLAHSLTLALATLNIVQIRSDIIEPTIAASIVYVGLENILRKGHPKGRWLLTFAFGLVHGFGFASVLREMEIAKGGNVFVPLVSFNLGVEAGQIAVAAIVLPLIWQLKKKQSFAPRWIPACSALVAAAGAFWFIQRVWF